MYSHQIPVRELTSRAAVFGIAAEIVQNDMQMHTGINKAFRIGALPRMQRTGWALAVTQDSSVASLLC